MKRLDGDGREIRGKACEYGRCVRDSLRKVLTVGHLGFVELVTPSPRCRGHSGIGMSGINVRRVQFCLVLPVLLSEAILRFR